MPVHRETHRASLALYQQALRTAERVKTLMREIDEISREVHQHLDDHSIILVQIQGKRRDVPCDLEKDSRCAVSVQNTVDKLPALSPLPIRSIPRVTRGELANRRRCPNVSGRARARGPIDAEHERPPMR
jgi:hypothetical protein